MRVTEIFLLGALRIYHSEYRQNGGGRRSFYTLLGGTADQWSVSCRLVDRLLSESYRFRRAPGPDSNYGIHPDEMTIAEVLKQKGYSTAIFGKWHLGSQKEFLPLQNGFDEYYGLPYSNDMWPFHPQQGEVFNFPDLPTYDGNEIIGYNTDQTRLTTDYTTRSVNFIKKNKNKPFFLYLAHNMPHVPLAVSDKFKGKSEQGLYGDVMMEIDWSVGEIFKTLRELGLEDNTLVILTSDNGPWTITGIMPVQPVGYVRQRLRPLMVVTGSLYHVLER